MANDGDPGKNPQAKTETGERAWAMGPVGIFGPEQNIHEYSFVFLGGRELRIWGCPKRKKTIF